MAIYQLSIPDISCGHCATAIATTARASGAADVTVDSGRHQVAVDIAPERLDLLRRRLAEAGYPVAETLPVSTTA